jgi:hypothetical protein
VRDEKADAQRPPSCPFRCAPHRAGQREPTVPLLWGRPVSLAEPDLVTLAELPAATSAELQMVN